MASSTRIPKAELTGVYGAMVKRMSRKMLGDVADQCHPARAPSLRGNAGHLVPEFSGRLPGRIPRRLASHSVPPRSPTWGRSR